MVYCYSHFCSFETLVLEIKRDSAFAQTVFQNFQHGDNPMRNFFIFSALLTLTSVAFADTDKELAEAREKQIAKSATIVKECPGDWPIAVHSNGYLFHVKGKGENMQRAYPKWFFRLECFSEDLAAVAVSTGFDGKSHRLEWYHIKRNGEPAYSVRFDGAWSFKAEPKYVRTQKFRKRIALVKLGNETFYIDPWGERCREHYR